MPNSAAQTNTSSSAHDAVFVPSAELPNAIPVRGFDFNAPPELDALLNAYLTTGFQGTSLALAVGEIKRMLEWRLSQEEVAADENEELKDEKVRKQVKCTIFLGYTSNLISSGLRESFRYLAEHKLVDCIVTTAGGAEEDLIKCLAPTFLLNLDSNNTSNDSKDAPRDSTNTTQPQTVAPDAWQTPGASLRRLGLNRIGNLVVPNSNYGMFEDWVMPILDGMLEEQKKEGKVWTPSLVMERLGREVGKLEKGRDSVAYWAWKNKIPIFSPALTDGSLGDMIYFHSFRNPGLIIDIAGDIRRLNEMAVWAKKAGVVVLGGGVVKHHLMNACLMRNGADFSVFINTAQEFDGSDAGARPDEAVSWGKIKAVAKPVKVYAEATLVWPLIMAGSFAKEGERRRREGKEGEDGK